jgi:hypothetical protein
MPLCTLHLLTLAPSTTVPKLLAALPIKPILHARPIRWIIVPAKFSPGPLPTTPPPPPVTFSLLLLLPGATGLPASVSHLVKADWHVTAGVPSSLLRDFDKTNERLLRPHAEDVPALTGSLDSPKLSGSGNTQDLELSRELLEWCTGGKGVKGAVTMLNLLAFTSDPEAHANYQKYGKAFADHVGSRRGGFAKIVGRVVGEGEKWQEIALAHYPSTVHFADMVASWDYQDANTRWRVGSLEDTCILCCSELVGYEGEERGGKARL